MCAPKINIGLTKEGREREEGEIEGGRGEEGVGKREKREKEGQPTSTVALGIPKAIAEN